MGLFNFIYKLTNILSNKRKIKVFIIIAIIILLIFCWSRGVFASTTEDANALTNYQLVLQESAMSYLRYLWKSGRFAQSTYNQLLDYMKSYNVYVTTSVNGDAQFIIYLYLTNINTNGTISNSVDDFTIDASWSLGVLPDGTISGTEYPCKVAQFEGYCFTIYRTWRDGHHFIENYNSQSFYLPDSCFMVRSNSVNEFLQENGILSEVLPTYSTHDAELQSAMNSGFTNQVNAINNTTSAVNDVNSSVEDVNQSVQDMIDTIVDPYVNVSQQQLPTNNVNDTTTDGLDSIFTLIKNAFTGEPQAVSFPIPFTNQSFTIEPGFTENSMRKGGLGAMVSVIHLYWYYRVGSFIFLKYVELFEKLKEGEFEETVGNIKKEVL